MSRTSTFLYCVLPTSSGRTDVFGNWFRYRAKINVGEADDSAAGKWAFDVFLTTK